MSPKIEPLTHRTTHHRGFTLIELILVLMIISITLAIASPSMRGWGQGQKLRNATDGFIAATGYARSQAVTSAKAYAVEIDAEKATYRVQSIEPGNVRKPVAGEFGQPAQLPTDYTIKLVSGGALADGGTIGKPAIVFYPDARGTPAVVEIKSSNGDVDRIESQSPAEVFKKVNEKK